MAMRKTFGQLGEKTDGLLAEVYWPSMATMDVATGDGRILDGEGGGVRDLPRTGFVQFAQDFGHMGSVAALRVDEITFEEDGNISGRGWIADTEEGRKLATLMAARVLFHNSIDLTEAVVNWEWDDENDDILLRFVSWNIGATTIVGKPAFANARAELVASLPADPSYDDVYEAVKDLPEITAALESDQPLEFVTDGFTITAPGLDVPELTAAADTVTLSHSAFFHPEASHPQKIVVTADGQVYGHLATWDGRFGVRPPRPRDAYASFNQPGPLTERGQVETGPIFFMGGHPDHPVAGTDVNKAYGGVENTWADVRVVEGVHGPWISGHVRPGISEETIHAARCSRISGHWVGDELVAIVSVNVARFNIPGSGLSAENSMRIEDGRVLELTASLFAPSECVGEPPAPAAGVTVQLDEARIRAWIDAALAERGILTEASDDSEDSDVDSEDEDADATDDSDDSEDDHSDSDYALEAELLALEMELQDDLP